MKPAQSGKGAELEHDTVEHLIRAFVPAPADVSAREDSGGNPCLLQILDQFPSSPVATTTQHTICHSWASPNRDGPLISVQCFTPGGRIIDCCGHGLLAAGHVWLRRLHRDALFLSMNESLVGCRHREGITWLRFKRVGTVPCAVPKWMGEVFPDQLAAVAAATYGDEKGYLVVQWPDDFDLKRLAPPDSCLSNRSQRAIICTAAQPATGTDAITLRYFAPQYGVLEDTATGSAMRILADYWSPRFSRLTAVQCSPVGGLLLAILAPDHVEIGGYCLTVQTMASNA